MPLGHVSPWSFQGKESLVGVGDNGYGVLTFRGEGRHDRWS